MYLMCQFWLGHEKPRKHSIVSLTHIIKLHDLDFHNKKLRILCDMTT